MRTIGLLGLAGGRIVNDREWSATYQARLEAEGEDTGSLVSPANAEVKQTAKVASEALETANYEQAVQSLTVIKARENLTLQQGTAVYNSEMALEAKLIAGVQAGDPSAIRAYELLKKSKRR